ncbi:MAG: hypothetical protein ABWW69_07320 [Pyrodictiaceae archaeon]
MLSLLSRIIGYVARSLFLYGLTRMRRGSSILAVAHMVLVTISLSSHSIVSSLPSLLLVMYMYYWSRMSRQLAYASIIALVPALWMGLTHLAARWAIGSIDYAGAVGVTLRAFIGSLHAFYMLHSLNTSELAYIAARVGGPIAGVAPHLVWRTTSLMLREASEMIFLHRLKGVRAWRSLAMLIVRGEEVSQLFTEGITLKTRVFRPQVFYDRTALMLQGILLAVDALSQHTL